MGRNPGDKNAKTMQWELMGEYLTDAGIQRYKELMDRAEGEDFIKYFMQLIEFFKPKLARKELTGKDGEELKLPIIQVEILKPANGTNENPA